MLFIANKKEVRKLGINRIFLIIYINSSIFSIHCLAGGNLGEFEKSECNGEEEEDHQRWSEGRSEEIGDRGLQRLWHGYLGERYLQGTQRYSCGGVESPEFEHYYN